ncbi:MAG TPA: TonB-dependent receptor [Gemmatimonadaceae bacterium]|nr:TonB-dependent receptor [Gemmatimonadaceae bacterium]
MRFLVLAALAFSQPPHVPHFYFAITRADARESAIMKQRVSLSIAGGSVTDVLDEITRQTGLRFSYSREQLPTLAPLTVTATNLTVAAALTEVLVDADLDVEIEPGETLVLLVPHVSAGQIQGRVWDANTLAPLEAVEVRLTGTTLATETDSAGRYSFAAAPPGTWHLVARRLGYRLADTVINVRDDQTMTVDLHLAAATITLGTVNVTGMSAEQREFLDNPGAGSIGLTGDEIRSTPQFLEPDPIRAAQMMPGVVTPSDRKVGFAVQGGAPDQNLVQLDNITLYAPDHFGGLFGTFIDGSVSGVHLYEAGFPAEYGGRMSSVVAVSSNEDDRRGVHGDVDVSLLSSNATVGGGYHALGGHGTWEVAARRTYADILENAIAPSVAIPFYFYDGQLHGTYTSAFGLRVSATAYGGRDIIDATARDTASATHAHLLYSRGNVAGGVTIAQPFVTGGGILGDSDVLEQHVSLTRYTGRFDQGNGSELFTSGVNDPRIGGSWTRYGTGHTVRVGYDLDWYRTRDKLSEPLLSATAWAGDQHTASIAAYAEDNWRPVSSLTITPGVRFEQVAAAHWTGWSPRVAIKYFARPDLAFDVAGGQYAQWLQLETDETSTFNLFDYWVASDATIPVAIARHAVGGAEKWFGSSRYLRVEGYYKWYTGVNFPNLAGNPAVPSTQFVQDNGRAYGVTLLLRQLMNAGHNFGGWLAYSYGVTQLTHADTTFYPLQDRRHTLNAVGTWRAGRYEIGTRLTYGTGTPYTPDIGDSQVRTYDPATGTWRGQPGNIPVLGTYDSKRYPDYLRLDLSVSRDYHWGSTLITPSLSVINATDHRNPFAYTWQYNSAPPTRTLVTDMPILPSIGVRVQF